MDPGIGTVNPGIGMANPGIGMVNPGIGTANPGIGTIWTARWDDMNRKKKMNVRSHNGLGS
jgi:hypothetical protein